MKKYILSCLLASATLLASMQTYAHSPSAPLIDPTCFQTPTGVHCIMPFVPKPIIPVPPYIPPAN